MNNVILHTEFLLKHHDCVVLPGWGAFVSRRLPARLDKENGDMMLPPCRRLTFNSELKETDGLVASSISRRDGVSYAEADRLLSAEITAALSQLENEGEFLFGHLGAFMKLPGTSMRFYPAVRSVNSMYYGLAPLRLRALTRQHHESEQAQTLPPLPVSRPRQNDDYEPSAQRRGWVGRWTRHVSAAVAFLAIAVTIGLFIMNPIIMDNEPNRASLAPIPSQTTALTAKSASQNVNTTSQTATSATPTIHATESVTEVMETSRGTDNAPQVAAAASQSITPSNIRDTAPAALRFDDSDPYVVVIASFPTEEQARQYTSEHTHNRLGILQKDGKYRIYNTTAATYNEAHRLKEASQAQDAWVCRR